MSNTTSTVRRAVGTLAAAAVLAGAGASSASAATTHQRHGDCAPSSRSAQEAANHQATTTRQHTSTRTLSTRANSTTRSTTPAASSTWRSRTDGVHRTAARDGAASTRTTTSTASRASAATSTTVRTTSATVASTSVAGTSTSTAGLSTNAVAVLRAVNAAFPQITDVGGLRSGSDAQDHATGHALDLMTSDKATGDEVAAYLQAHAEELGVHYVIWRQHIWNVQRAQEGWRPMADRGSVTANHYDHVHVSVN